MARASDTAKEMIMNTLKEIFPSGGIIDKKFYINFSIEGEDTQICISLTAPKTPVVISADGGSTASSGSTTKSIPTYNEEQIKREAEEIFDFFKL